MTKTLLVLSVLAISGAAFADPVSELNNKHFFPDKSHAQKPSGQAGTGGNLVNHGGPVIAAPYVVAIFWGPQWSSAGTPEATAASHIQGFFGQFSGSGHLNMLSQYSGAAGQAPSNMLSHTVWDTSTPPTNVTDAILQQEVIKSLGGAPSDPSTIYEVFLPSTSYSSDGTSTSCGGTNLAYCAYHGHFSYNGQDVKYSSMPWPGCGGCQSSGFSIGQNFDHFSCHETREAITDEDLNAWYDRRGNEADDKCAWSPAPFIDSSGYAYQYEWSNSAGGCVK